MTQIGHRFSIIHPYTALIIGGSGSGKTTVLLNLMKKQDDDNHRDIDNIQLYSGSNINIQYQHLIKEHKENGLENPRNPKHLLIEYSNNMQDVYKNIEENNPDRKCNVLIVFDDTIDDMLGNDCD